MSDIDEVVLIWKNYVDSIDNWESLIKGITPKNTICGPVYERPSPLEGRSETFAIGDMRRIKVAHPHYHKNGETEIYFVLQGSGLTVVGGEERYIEKGSVVVTPPDTAHFTIPKYDLVLVIVNTPSFNPNNNIEIEKTDSSVKFDRNQYDKLLRSLTIDKS
jgi:mannose-6-phosphate isomerase-like protein (cupin superfamily)